MKSYLLLLPLLALSLSGCQMLNMVNASTRAINSNRCAVERSTAAINQNIQNVGEANQAIEKNRQRLESMNES